MLVSAQPQAVCCEVEVVAFVALQAVRFNGQSIAYVINRVWSEVCGLVVGWRGLVVEW